MSDETRTDPVGTEATLTRLFDAPRHLVFEAWTNPEHLARWWGPNDFTNPVCEVDLRPGGTIRIDMTAPDGSVFPMVGVFEEVVSNERLVFRAQAFVGDATEPMLEDRTTVTFADRDGKTEVVVHGIITKAGPGAEFAAEGMEEGWSQSLDRLASFLAGEAVV